MRLAFALFLAGCGALSSGPGTPPPVPSTGLGASTPWSDDTGLSWSPPFIFADPAQALFHPTAIADGDAIDLWAESTRGTAMSPTPSVIVHSRAPSFADGFVDSDVALATNLPWEDSLHAPAVIAIDDARYLFFVSSGEVGLCELTHMNCRQTPLYFDGRIRSLGAALVDQNVHVVILVGETLSQLTIPATDLLALVDNSAAMFHPSDLALDVPSWGLGFLDVGLRAEHTSADRWREDLFFACSLPSTADLGTIVPSAIGAASRYHGDLSDPPFAVVEEPILGGSPSPRSPAVLDYDGGTMLLYSASSGPRSGIGVALHP